MVKEDWKNREIEFMETEEVAEDEQQREIDDFWNSSKPTSYPSRGNSGRNGTGNKYSKQDMGGYPEEFDSSPQMRTKKAISKTQVSKEGLINESTTFSQSRNMDKVQLAPIQRKPGRGVFLDPLNNNPTNSSSTNMPIIREREEGSYASSNLPAFKPKGIYNYLYQILGNLKPLNPLGGGGGGSRPMKL
jgi:hypothetical protein